MAHIGQHLTTFAKGTPDKPALKFGDRILSWKELVQKVTVAEGQIRHRSDRGSRIGLCLSDPVDLLICFLACTRLGRIAMVFDPEWLRAQLETVCGITSPDFHITDPIVRSFDRQDPLAIRSGAAAEMPPPCETDPFYVGFTSGSTGVPKGYLRNQGSWLESFHLSDVEFGMVPAARVVLAGKLVHSLHLYGAVYGLERGQEVVLLPQFDPKKLLREISGSPDGAILYATPTQVHYLAETAERHGTVDTLKQVLVSGAKWSDADRRVLGALFPATDLYEFYGASETSFVTVHGPHDPVPAGSVGAAANGVEIAIGAPEAPEPPGKDGPIWVRSALLFSGYVSGKSDDTRWQDGWLTFGDHGHLDDNGYLFVTGRTNRMVITSGLNVYPEEVEAVLTGNPDVAQAVVLGVSDPVRGQVLEAVVVLAREEANEGDLLTYCKERLAPGKVPRRFHFRKTLPLTAGGKSDIQKIKAELHRNGSSAQT